MQAFPVSHPSCWCGIEQGAERIHFGLRTGPALKFWRSSTHPLRLLISGANVAQIVLLVCTLLGELIFVITIQVRLDSITHSLV